MCRNQRKRVLERVLIMNKDEISKVLKVSGRLYKKGFSKEDLKVVVDAGMIAKDKLKDGKYYTGYCSFASSAVWNSEREVFTCVREKYGQLDTQDIHHPEDDIGLILFIPYLKKLLR